MQASKLSAKGQVTIPRKVRERLGALASPDHRRIAEQIHRHLL